MQDIGLLFRAIGITETESKVYLSAVRRGPSSAAHIAHEVGLARQSVYEIIESLQKKFLMGSITKGTKRYFIAEHPEKLRTLVERREQDLRDLKSDLDRTIKNLELQMGGDKPVIHVFEGKDGIEAILKDMQKDHATQVFEISDLNALQKVLTREELNPIREEATRKGMKVVGFYDGPLSQTTTNAERYALPKDFGDFRSNITIYGNKIAMLTFEDKMHSVVIESAALAKTLRVLFELSSMTAKEWKEKRDIMEK